MTREHPRRPRAPGAPPILYGFYGFAVFLSSAVTLVLEITAGRLIAPYVGVSIYSWTSIIGVVLAGLALGNWLGGALADRDRMNRDAAHNASAGSESANASSARGRMDRDAAHGAGCDSVHGSVHGQVHGSTHGSIHGADRMAGFALVAAALASLGVLLVLTFVAPAVIEAELSPMGGAFVLAFSLFFVPAVLLGVITPLLTTLALRRSERPGRVVGSMHALAALGSIAGTFAAGFWLIQYLGTRNILILCAVVLLALAAPFLLRRRKAGALALGAASALLTGWITEARGGFLNPCTAESQYYCIRVEPASADAPFGEARALVLDHLVHGISHATEPGMLISPYVHLTDELVLGYLGAGAAGARYFFAGGGAYTHPRAVRALAPHASITVAEIDPAVTAVAARELYFDGTGVRILHADARMALRQLGGERFDVVVGDVVHDLAAPSHLLTREYAALVKSRLEPDGLYVLNVIDAWPDPLLVKSLLNTLREHFRHVHVWLEALPDAPVRETFILSATDRFEPPRAVAAQRGFERRWIRVTHHLESSGAPLDTLPVLTDDFVPVERLIGRLTFTGLGR